MGLWFGFISVLLQIGYFPGVQTLLLSREALDYTAALQSFHNHH